MRTKRFKVKGNWREYDVRCENFSSTQEVIAVTRARSAPDESWKREIDFCDESWTSYKKTGTWYGFNNKDEYERLVRFGVEDTSVVKDVRKYSAKASVLDKDKLAVRCMDIVGGGVNVPVYLTGNPQCMYTMKRKKVKSKIVTIGIECGLTCDYSAKQYQRAGMALTKVVAKLEKAGYRVALISMAAFIDEKNDVLCMMTNVIKRENTPMNYSRIMFPLTSITYFRGLAFGWVARNKDYRGYSNLGPHFSSIFPYGERNERIEEMFQTAVGHDNFIAVSMKQMVGICDGQGQEALERYIEGKIMEVVG